ncbi:MAG TPA: glycoside hydrolase family 16 protein, partial [Polyangiaceae bacterium]
SEAGASLDGAPPPNGTGGGGTIVVPPPGWTLLWSDEFDGPDGSDVDPTKWIHDVGEGSTTTEGAWSPGYGWGNDELEYYTAGSANTQQQGGNLVISATKNADPSLVCYFADDPSSASTTYHAGTCEYASGRIKTVLGPKAGATGAAQENLFSHLYGRFEMRAQIPPGVGLWPAFWMMGTNIFSQSWPACGELDIMEEVGDQPGTVHGTSHSTASGDDGVTFTSTLPHGAILSDAFHVYAIEWTPTKLTWLLDDAVYGTQTAPSGATASNWPFTDPKNPFFLILNLAISSGDANSWGAAPTSATPFPAQMKVDYVRVFEPANGDD